MADKEEETAALVEDVIVALKNRCPEIRHVAARVIGEQKLNTEKTVQGLVLLLEDGVLSVRITAGWSLSRLGLEADKAGPVLVRALPETQARERNEVLNALINFGPAVTDLAIPIFILETLRTNDTDTIAAIAEFGSAAISAVPFLVQLLSLEEGNYRLQQAAVQALGKIGPSAKSAVPLIAKALRSRDTGLCIDAMITLEQIGATPEGIGELVAVFDYRDPESGRVRNRYPGVFMLGGLDIHARVAKLLGDLGADAKEAVPALEGLLVSPTKDEFEQQEKERELQAQKTLETINKHQWQRRSDAREQIRTEAEARCKDTRITSTEARQAAAAALEKIRKPLNSTTTAS